MPSVEFGYNPPSGDRGQEHIRPREFLQDLHRSLDVASQGFDSLWVSDHLNYAAEFRLECWTMLSWIARRYPGPRLGTIVMSNSFRSPSLMAKMGASLQEMSSAGSSWGTAPGGSRASTVPTGTTTPPLAREWRCWRRVCRSSGRCGPSRR